jgi:peptidoglycan/LPS O-acetylase OafA/YrhL
MGAILAIAVARVNNVAGLRRILGYLCLMALILHASLLSLPFSKAFWTLETAVLDTLTAIVFCWLVLSAGIGFTGVAGRLLSARPMVFVGTISYGIYVYHLLVPGMLRALSSWAGIPMPTGVYALAALYISITLAISIVSAIAFERPINRLKRHFEYGPGPTAAVATSPRPEIGREMAGAPGSPQADLPQEAASSHGVLYAGDNVP